MNRLAASLLTAALLLGAAGGALAHRFHFGIAEISDNASAGSVEVVHTLMAHDLDALLEQRHKRQVDLSQPEEEAMLRAYVDEKFYLVGEDGKRLPLKWVGMTAGVDNVVIYQELEGAQMADIARVHNEVLADFLPRQVNTLNIKRGAAVVSLTFDAKTTERPMK